MSVWRARVQIDNDVLGGSGVNTWHLRPEALIFDVTEMNLLMGHLADYYAVIKNEHASGTHWTFDGVLIRVDDDSSDIETVTPWAVDSTTSQASLPPANCIVTGWRTSRATRRGHGRTFHGPIGTNALSGDGTVGTDNLLVFQDAALDFIDTFSGIDIGAFGVWSREDNVLRDFTTAVVHDKFAVLRSRRD